MIKKILHYSLLVLVPLFLTGCSLKPADTTTTTSEQTLTIWRQPVNKKIDDSSFANVIAGFKKANKDVKVVYRSFDSTEDYETGVLNALAAGSGPDVWEIRNDELPRHIDKIIPLTPASVDNPEYFRSKYAATIADEMVSGNQLYGMPMGVDPLVLFVNSLHLQEAKIEAPPETWQDLIQTATILTRKVDDKIFRPGFAMGTVSNVDRASQILELIMLQFKTQMTDSAKRTATFDLYSQTVDNQTFDYPGQNAVQLFSLFANPASGIQTWDISQPYSTQAFAAGNLSMMINYQSIAPQLKEINPKLDFKVALVPQRVEKTFPQGDLPGSVSDPVYTARYRALVASKPSVKLNAKQQTAKQDLARSFIVYSTSKKVISGFDSQNWLMQAQTPTADDNVTRKNPMHANLKTWHKGPSPRTVDQIMSEMLKAVAEGNLPLAATMTQAAQLITGILK